MFFSGLFQRKSDAPVTTPAELADAIGLSYDTYNGTLWQPNQRVIVFDPVCGFDNTELLVSEVTFTQDQNGTLTEIRVGPPDAYLPEPEDPGARKKKKARVQEDPF